MEFAGILPPDAPDPRLEWIEKAKAMPVPVLGFVPQRHLEDWDAIGVGSSTSSAHGLEQLEAVVTYTLWRNPDDRADPVNLAPLDDATLAGLDVEPPWPRPQWLLDGVERMRLRTLWEGVRTTWVRERDAYRTVEAILVHHVNHVLMNRFRRELGLSGRPWERDRSFEVTERHVQHGIPVEVDGEEVSGIRVDTDPFVYGLGADLGQDGILTAVVPRDDLPYVRLAFARRAFD